MLNGCGHFRKLTLFLFCQRQHEKRNIYNLNEDEELTHYGQSLADIEKLNDVVDSDSDTEERGTLSGKGRSRDSRLLTTSLAWAPWKGLDRSVADHKAPEKFYMERLSHAFPESHRRWAAGAGGSR